MITSRRELLKGLMVSPVVVVAARKEKTSTESIQAPKTSACSMPEGSCILHVQNVWIDQHVAESSSPMPLETRFMPGHITVKFAAYPDGQFSNGMAYFNIFAGKSKLRAFLNEFHWNYDGQILLKGIICDPVSDWDIEQLMTNLVWGWKSC